MSSYDEAREAAARAVERARKESAAAHFGHGTEDPEVWKLCRRQDGGEVELFVGPMDKMIEAMDASIAKDISNAAIDAFLGKLSETHAVVVREGSDAMLIAGINEWVMQGATPRGFGRNDAMGTTINGFGDLRKVLAAMLAQEVKG